MTVSEDFRAAMRRHGLNYAGPLHADGKLHRVRVEDDKERNSWYVLFAGPPMGGAFGCWKRGFKETWCDRGPKSYSDGDWKKIREQWSKADEERDREEERRQKRARESAAWILNHAKPADANHPYLVRKAATLFG